MSLATTCRTALTAILMGILSLGLALSGGAAEDRPRVPENPYRGELVSYPGAWSFQFGKYPIILVSDKELEALADRDKVLNLALGFDKNEISLRKICEQSKAAGQHTVILAFDHFFSQYRPGQEGPRKLTPDMDEYVARIAAISKFAQQYGLGLELSLLSPLEIGPAYEAKTGESGEWMHYRKGLRDPRTGAFNVQLWQQKRWNHNKGPVDIKDAGVRVFAFKESPIGGTPYHVVDPAAIREITGGIKVQRWGKDGDVARRIVVTGKGHTDLGDLNRVLVVQQYRTPEMDYFSPKSLPFLKELVDKYTSAGVKLNGLYSDEMHIDQDWDYFGHHDNGEFALRYVSKGLADKYAQLYGAQYKDFAKYLIYFTYGQEDTAHDLSAKSGGMHVFGATPEAIRRTALFRARYFHLLQDGVVDLFTDAKRYAEEQMGHRLESRAHATWAESPTIDKWDTGQEPLQRQQYEYTSNFVWSCTVQQASAACYDYFKWGDYLTGNGNDHPEGGWLDRDYFALALACSTGMINEVPYSYCAHWGMPDEIGRRRMSLVNAYGASGSPLYGMVEDMVHRDVDVLMLYPIDLVAVEERFGSWMSQYGYANYITQAKLLERGKIVNGAIEIAGRRFTTLATTFEPFPSNRLLDMMKQFAESGGRVIWSGPPPVLTAEGESALPAWQGLFGVTYTPGQNEGIMAPGKQIVFDGMLSSVQPQIVLTDFMVDRIYPVVPNEGIQTVARAKDRIVGTCRTLSGGGTATFLGYRPRDDQAKSLGYDPRNWFDVLTALGAYTGTGRFAGINDNTEHISRTTDYLACRFPNGAIAITRHLKDLEEAWPGGFARDQKWDADYIKRCPPPSEALELRDMKVNGHTVTYDGQQAVTFRVNDAGDLIAFAGSACKQITIDGKTTVFADRDIPQLAWAPVREDRRVPGGAILQIMVYGTGQIRIPARTLPASLRIFTEGATPGSKGTLVPSHRDGDTLIFDITPEFQGRWTYGVPQ